MKKTASKQMKKAITLFEILITIIIVAIIVAGVMKYVDKAGDTAFGKEYTTTILKDVVQAARTYKKEDFAAAGKYTNISPTDIHKYMDSTVYSLIGNKITLTKTSGDYVVDVAADAGAAAGTRFRLMIDMGGAKVTNNWTDELAQSMENFAAITMQDMTTVGTANAGFGNTAIDDATITTTTTATTKADAIVLFDNLK